MSAIGTTSSYASDITSLPNGNALGGPQANQGSAASVDLDRGPATLVNLSDGVKQLLARAIGDQGIADRLWAFVEQRGLGGNTPSSDQDAASNITQAFEQLSGGTSTGVFSTAFGSSDGVSVQSYQSDNKDYITFSESGIAATNVTASSDSGTVSSTSVGTHAGSLTFVVDLATDSISINQAEATSEATSVQIGSNQSAFSTLA